MTIRWLPFLFGWVTLAACDQTPLPVNDATSVRCGGGPYRCALGSECAAHGVCRFVGYSPLEHTSDKVEVEEHRQ